jgi:glycosyltransferase involved in cell wall biosynthesis
MEVRETQNAEPVTDSPVITVLITTYNYGRFIEQTIDSVLSQDFPLDQVQIVVVDDGSTDDTAERLKKYGSRIEYYRKPNGGQASALNFGISKARGEILALLDADDLFLPGKLARIAEAFERNPALGMVYHRLQEWHMESGERREWSDFFPVSGDAREDSESFVHYVPQPTSCIAFRRSALKDLLPIPEEIRMLADCYVVALIPFRAPILAIAESLTVYRIHGRNSYSTSEAQVPTEASAKRLRMWEIVIGAMRKWLEEHGYSRKQAAVRSLLDRWTLLLQREEFAIRAPGRLQFFRYLLQCYRYQLHRMTWKLRVINYCNALGSLVVGYKNFHRLDEHRENLTRRMRTLLRRATPAQRP